MKVKVNEQPQRFYIALDKWTPAAGHEICVGDFCFAAIPTEDSINVIEVSTGYRVLEIPWTRQSKGATQTKEQALRYFERVAKEIAELLEQQQQFSWRIADLKKQNKQRLGDKPPTENIDVEFEAYKKERTE